jgi:hypothetical protein
MSEETVTFNLELNVEQALSSIRRIETLLYRIMGLLRRMGLSEDVEKAVLSIQKLIMTIRLLHTAIVALEAASGPVGWALAIVGMGTAALSASDFLAEMHSS